ncbi:DUF3515 domain-containing protein [Kitasatospora sp. NPDC052896]|uniref:DUF3515 domain-containing protein n=1 Tax=Kitasatospora sp. NPDC052896 TaxID=3364061 RepID=UPI0037CA0161
MPSRLTRLLHVLPATVRWSLLPAALLACLALVTWSGATWEPPVTPPEPRGQVADHCRALAAALPATVQGHRRTSPTASPYVAVWSSSPRTVLRCGVPRPKSLGVWANRIAPGPYVSGVQWYIEKDGHGGYRLTVTQRSAYVELSVPAGAYPNYSDPLVDLSPPIAATLETYGHLGPTDDS